MFRVYICTMISDEISYYTHKTELPISLSQNIGLWKQIALAILTFGLATAILNSEGFLSSSLV